MTQVVVAYTSNTKKRIQFFEKLQTVAENWHGYVGQPSLHSLHSSSASSASTSSSTIAVYDQVDIKDVENNSSFKHDEVKNGDKVSNSSSWSNISTSTSTKNNASWSSENHPPGTIPVTVKLMPLFPQEYHQDNDDDEEDDDDDDDNRSNNEDSENYYTSSIATEHVHAIIHKRTDLMVESILHFSTEHGDENNPNINHETDEQQLGRKRDDAKKKIQLLTNILENTQAVVIDLLPGVWQLLDRCQIANAIDASLPYFALPWAVCQAHENWSVTDFENLRFPVIIKRKIACGTKHSDDMVVAYNPTSALSVISSLFRKNHDTRNRANQKCDQQQQEAENQRQKQNCGKLSGSTKNNEVQQIVDADVVVQEFIPDHGGVIFKVYAIGDQIIVRPRSSVDVSMHIDGEKNKASPKEINKTHTVDSLGREHIILTKPKSRSSCEDESYFMFDYITGRSPKTDAIMPPIDIVRDIVQKLGTELQLSLLGIDIVYNVVNQRHFIIDVNYFPGYKCVSNVHEKFLQHICNKVWDDGQLL